MSRRMFLYIGVIAVSLTIIGTSVYYLLGGMDPIRVYELPAQQRIIVGKPFKGRYTNNEIARQFAEARKLVLDSAIIGILAQVVYQDSTLADNEISFFTGVAIEGSMAEVPAGYQLRKFNCPQKYAVFLSMHPLVRPSPRKVEAMLAAKADSSNYKLQPFLIELHYYDDTMSVEAFASTKK